MHDVEQLPVAGTVILLRPDDSGFEVLLMRRPARGSFPDAWVFPGGRVEGPDRRPGAEEIDDARRAGIRETFEEVGLAVDEAVVLSCWHPPAEAPTRIRTWFFLAPAPREELTTSAAEVVEAVWIRPADALRAHAAGEWTLFPPTWMTLEHLRRFESAEAVQAAAGEPEHFATKVVRSADGPAFEWGRVRLETGSLPWRIVEG